MLKTFITSFANEDIVPLVMCQLKSNNQVQKGWQFVIRDKLDSEQLCEALLDAVLVSWIQTKGRQIAKKYTFNMKRKGSRSQASRMGTPAMRRPWTRYKLIKQTVSLY